ncbi:hypothetical protein [Paenibacillus sp.]
MKTYGLPDDDIRLLTKRAVARNMLKGMSIEEAFESVDIVFEYYKYRTRDLDPIDVPTDEEDKLNEAMKQIPNKRIYEFIKSQRNKNSVHSGTDNNAPICRKVKHRKRNNKTNLNENKKIRHITSYIFTIESLSPLKGKVYITYSDGTSMLIGRIHQSPIDGDIIYTDADLRPISHFLKFTDLPRANAEHGTTHMIGFMSKLATSFIGQVGEVMCISALEIKDLDSVLSGLDVYSVHPLTAYVTYHSEYKRKKSVFNGISMLDINGKYIDEKTDESVIVTFDNGSVSGPLGIDLHEVKIPLKELKLLVSMSFVDKTTDFGWFKCYDSNIPLRLEIGVGFDNDNTAVFQARGFMVRTEIDRKEIFSVIGYSLVEVLCQAIKFCKEKVTKQHETIKEAIDKDLQACLDFANGDTTTHSPEKEKRIKMMSPFSAANIAKNMTQAMVAIENDQSCALFVRDPINGNEYTLNIAGFDEDGRLLAHVVKMTKEE